MYFVAPNTYFGNQSSAYGKLLTFDLMQILFSRQPQSVRRHGRRCAADGWWIGRWHISFRPIQATKHGPLIA